MYTIKNMDLIEKRLRSIEKLIGNTHKKLTSKSICSEWKKVVSGIYTCLVLNFDGTLRDKYDRNGPINPNIASEICRIASKNENEIYIATGRKQSGLKIVKDFVNNKEFEIKMILGNGADIISLPSGKVIYSSKPFKSSEISDIFHCIVDKCGFDKENIHSSNNMIRIFLDCDKLAAKKVEEVSKNIKFVSPEVTVTHSGFNIEIVPKEITKEIAIRRLIDNRKITEILTIGDSGCQYGNDFGMLSNFPSFCVGDDSKNFIGWTLPVIDNQGSILTGPDATLYLLNHISVNN